MLGKKLINAKNTYENSFLEKKNVIFGNNTTTNYHGTLKNDYIFTGNGDNDINLVKNTTHFQQPLAINAVFNTSYSNSMYKDDIDYVETGTGNNIIRTDNNYVNYYLRGNNTILGDFAKGSISLNGKKVDGSDFSTHTNFNYEYINKTNGFFDLKITDQTVQNSSVIITDVSQIKLANLGIEHVPVYNNLATPDSSSFNLDKNLSNNQNNPFKATIIEHNGRVDGDIFNPNNYTYNLNLVKVNAGFYKENNDLYILDEQTLISHKFVDFFNPNLVNQYSQNSNGDLTPVSVNHFDSINLADGTFSIYNLTTESNPNSIILPQEYTPNQTPGYTGNENIYVNIRPYDKITFDSDINFNGSFSRQNDDLIYKSYGSSGFVNYRNYFKINEFSNGNGLYLKDRYGNLTSISNVDFKQYMGAVGTTGDDQITINNNFGLAYGGDGNNKLIGNSGDNTFIVKHSSGSSNIPYDILDGGDGGNDTYKVVSGVADVIISNFKQNDKLIVGDVGIFGFSVENNDLVMMANNRFIRLQNYMLNKTDFGTNSGIYFGNSDAPFDLSALSEQFNTSLFATDSSQTILDSISKTDVKRIFDNNNNNTIVVRNSNTDVFISGGDDIVEKLGGSMNINIETISQGSLVIKNFDSSTDKLNLDLLMLSTLGQTLEPTILNNDLILNANGYSITIENYGTNFDSSNSGINIFNSDGSLTSLTKESIYNLSLGEADYLGVINGSGVRTSVIHSSFTDGKTVKGTNNSDYFNIIGNVTVLTSNGSDTFNLTDQSKILTIKYDTDFVNYFENYNKLNFNLDPNTNLQDVKFYFNAQNGNVSIVTGVDSNNNPKGILLSNFPIEYMSYLDQFISCKLNNVDVPVTGISFNFGEPLDLNAKTIESNTSNDLIYLTEDKKLLALSKETGTILYGTSHKDMLESDKGNNLLFGGSDDDLIVGNYQNKTQNGNLIMGAEGNDNIYAGDNDIINFYQGSDNDTIFSTDNSHIKLNIMKMPEDETFALSFSTENNNLMIKYNNLQNDVITLKDFWNKSNNFDLYVNSVNSQGTNTKVYALNEILTRLNMNKDTINTFTVNYSDGLDLIKQTYSNEMLGGAISTYPMLQNSNELTLVGIDISNTHNILNNLNTTPVSSIMGA